MWDKRYTNLRFTFIACVLTFGLVWCLMRGETVGAVLFGVFWTFYVAIGLASLVVWLRQRSTRGSHDAPRQ